MVDGDRGDYMAREVMNEAFEIIKEMDITLKNQQPHSEAIQKIIKLSRALRDRVSEAKMDCKQKERVLAILRNAKIMALYEINEGAFDLIERLDHIESDLKRAVCYSSPELSKYKSEKA